MKTLSFKYATLLSLAASLSCGSISRAQDDDVETPLPPRVTETRTTETTTMGSLGEFGDDQITVRTETSEEPVHYSFSKTTTWVDETGAPVSRETMKSGLPVTVHYTRTPEGMVAQKVVVRKKTTTTPEGGSKTTSSTTTIGTVGEFGKDQIIVKTESSKEPLHYRFTKTTTYVDEAGNPVSVETIKSGAPVKIEYTKVDDGLVAKRVIVRKTTSTMPARTTKTSRTTTTTSNGTFTEMGTDAIVIKTEAAEPVRYRFTKTTTYVDEAGAPVSIDTVKSGAPLSVQYIQDGDSMVAEKVIVRTTTTRRE